MGRQDAGRCRGRRVWRVMETRVRAVLRHGVGPVIAAGFLVAVPLVSAPSQVPAQAQWTPMSPVNVSYNIDTSHGVAKGRLVAFNDFHGAIDPPIGSGGLVNGVPAGGVEYL